MNEVVIAIIIVSVILFIFILILTFSIKRINSLLKKIFVDKLQEYDLLISEKEEKVNKLNDYIDDKESYYNELKNKTDSYKEERKNKENNEVNLPSEADYQDENILTGYKKIRQNFNFNIREAIVYFLKQYNNNDDTDYRIYSKIRNKFDFDAIYKISTYSSDNQKIIIEELLSKRENIKVNNLLNKRNFNIKSFIKTLDSLIIKSSPYVKVYVGNKKRSYNDLSNRIQTIYDESIVEGFRIEYQGVVYDFSF